MLPKSLTTLKFGYNFDNENINYNSLLPLSINSLVLNVNHDKPINFIDKLINLKSLTLIITVLPYIIKDESVIIIDPELNLLKTNILQSTIKLPTMLSNITLIISYYGVYNMNDRTNGNISKSNYNYLINLPYFTNIICNDHIIKDTINKYSWSYITNKVEIVI